MQLKKMYKYIFNNLDPTVFNSEVQICRYEGLDQVQMDQGIDQTEWGQWDIQTLAEKDDIVSHVNVNIFPVTVSDSETSSVYTVESNSSVPTVGYDITSDMIIDCDIDLDSLNESVYEPSVNEIPLPDRDTVMAELNVLGGDQSPPADFVMPTDYYPASPIYSPASPAKQNASGKSKHVTNQLYHKQSTITQTVNLNMALLQPKMMDNNYWGEEFLLCHHMIQTQIWTGTMSLSI